MSERGRTIREAILLALEATTPTAGALHPDQQVELTAVRYHVMGWVHSYAESRGVILADRDITGELDQVLGNLRGAP